MSSCNELEQQQQQAAKVALITGSSSGIGEAIAKEFAKLNYNLVITGRSEMDIRRVAQECKQLSPQSLEPLEIRADLGKLDDVDNLFRKVMEHYSYKLDVLVNNAAYAMPVDHGDIDGCFFDYKKTMSINMETTVRLTLLSAPYLKTSTNGSIINISSIASFQPGQIGAAYSASKAAMNMYSKAMAVELAPNIRVNYICPGPIATKIIERSGLSLNAFKHVAEEQCLLKRIGLPEEVAHAVVFLASDKASFITGSKLVIDGGVTLRPLTWDKSKQ